MSLPEPQPDDFISKAEYLRAVLMHQMEALADEFCAQDKPTRPLKRRPRRKQRHLPALRPLHRRPPRPRRHPIAIVLGLSEYRDALGIQMEACLEMSTLAELTGDLVRADHHLERFQRTLTTYLHCMNGGSNR